MKTDPRKLKTLIAILKANPNITSLSVDGITITQSVQDPVVTQAKASLINNLKKNEEQVNSLDHQFDRDLAEWEKMMDEGMSN